MRYTALFTLGLFASFSSYAIAQSTSTDSPVPAEIQVPSEQQLLLTVSAEGDQIYICQPKADSPTRFEWALKAPEAQLFDQQGELIGTHYGGPSWELNDGSKVVGQLEAKADAPDSHAIPWLLLQVKTHEGDGILNSANWIQRVNTIGGKAPKTSCDSDNQNQEVRVSYLADYHFFGNQN